MNLSPLRPRPPEASASSTHGWGSRPPYPPRNFQEHTADDRIRGRYARWIAPWFARKPVDERFFEAAPLRLRGGFEIPRPAAAVWAELTADDALHWCRILQDVRWTSPRPFGVGTTREVTALWGANRLRERYFRWEEGRRHSFYAAETNNPLFAALAEDYLVEPRGEAACRFTWTIAAAPSLLARPAAPLNRAIFKTLLTDTARHYGLTQADPSR